MSSDEMFRAGADALSGGYLTGTAIFLALHAARARRSRARFQPDADMSSSGAAYAQACADDPQVASTRYAS